MENWLYNEEHENFRKKARSFVEKEIIPFIDDWERAEEFPKELYRRMGEQGFFSLKFPKEYGGTEAGLLTSAVLIEEMTRSGSGGTDAGLGAHHGIALTPVWKFGNDDQKRRYLAPGIRGEKIAALGITEADTGSDVASIRTTARKEEDYYILNGNKMFITNGVRADFVVIAAKTDPTAKHKGISLFIVDTDSPGFSVGRKLKKLGWRSSDTAELILEDVKVPLSNLIGEENKGFYYVMGNFQWERLIIALKSVNIADLAMENAIRLVKERAQAGLPIDQATRYKLADLTVEIEKARHLTYHALYLHANGLDDLTEITMAKALAAEMVREVTEAVLQLFGGEGYLMDSRIQLYWRDARLYSIGGGTTEIMNEILVKRLGIGIK
ncbi:acyl-CoA dehydrogenase family protein [Peribacillus frigoritolerans]|uniref:acyl-CoA dehydrogenase family protein n=1 Tax=Peribacillus frigoritolerans TaxID=450367 RepID=UPI003821001E